MHREEWNEIRIGTDLFYDTSFYHKINKILDTTVITTYNYLKTRKEVNFYGESKQ